MKALSIASSLPYTGGNGLKIAFIVSGVLAVCAVVFVLVAKKKENKSDSDNAVEQNEEKDSDDNE